MGTRKPILALSDQPAASSNILTPLTMGPNDIPLDQIHINPDNPPDRVIISETDSFVESVRQYGILQPIVLIPDETGYTVLAGNRRVTAARMAHLASIPAVVRHDLTQEDSALINLIENGLRCDLTPIEEAIQYRRLIDTKEMSQSRIATIVGRSQGSVSQRLALLALDPLVQALVHEGLLSAWDAYQEREADPDVQHRAAVDYRATSGSWGWRGQLADTQRSIRHDKAVEKAKNLAEEAGIPFIEDMPTSWGSYIPSDQATVKNLRGADKITVVDGSIYVPDTKKLNDDKQRARTRAAERQETQRAYDDMKAATARRREFVGLLLTSETPKRWTRLAEAYIIDAATTASYMFVGSTDLHGYEHDGLGKVRDQGQTDPQQRRHASWVLMVLAVEAQLASSCTASRTPTVYSVYRDLLTETGWTPTPIEDTILGNPTTPSDVLMDSDDEPAECEGHPAGPFDPMGQTVFCDGSCRTDVEVGR